MNKLTDLGITFTQTGQSRPYGDSVYAGTVIADSEAEAKEKLAQANGGTINDKQVPERWWEPYFEACSEKEPGLWQFKYRREYTD